MAYGCRDITISLKHPKLKKSQSINTFQNERKKVFEQMFALEITRKDKINSWSFRLLVKLISSRWRRYFFDVIGSLYPKEQE